MNLHVQKHTAIYRFEVPVDDRWHEHDLTGPMLHVGSREGAVVEFWAHHDPGAKPARRRFRVYGTGHPIEPGLCYVGTTADGLNKALIWHLMVEPLPRCTCTLYLATQPPIPESDGTCPAHPTPGPAYGERGGAA